jgi:hypothetical protein
MFSGNTIELFLQVIKSWQVLVITGALILYIFLVNYVARIYHSPRFVSKSKPRKRRVKLKKADKSGENEAPVKDNSNEALGLEET